MMSTRTNNIKKIALWVLVFATLISAITLSLAIFTDRVNRTASMTISTFDISGYSLERTAPEGYFIAGETVDAVLKETNTQDTNLKSQVTMRVIWDSPVAGVYPWGNTSVKNAVVSLDGTTVAYTVNADRSISFVLPQRDLPAGDTIERTLKFLIPDDLASTGRLMFEFDNVELVSNGWTGEYDHSKLDVLDYDVGVAWNISKSQTTALGNPNRDVLAVLTETDRAGEYGLHIFKNGDDKNTNQGQMMDWSGKDQTPWADYVIVDLAIDEKVTTIGDYAFAEETGITSVDIPDTITGIGTSAFDGSGLTGELIIPASVEVIESLGFGNLPTVNVITFEHGSDDSLTLPNNEAAGKENTGAFYVPSYVETTVNSNVEEIQYGYKWFNDNRRTAPMLNAAYTWRYTSDGNGGSVEHIALYDSTIQRLTLLDYYMPDGTELKSWDASDPSVPGTVTAYICADGTSLILAGNGYGRIYTNPDSYGAFRDLGVLTTFENSTLLDTSKTTDMSYMFGYCSNLTGLDVSRFDTSNVTTLGGMFYEDYNLPELAVSEFDTGNVTNMMGVFTSCRSLTELDVTKWDTRKVTTMMYMFNGCSGLTELDLRTRDVKVDATTSYISWDTSSVTNMTRMFLDCTKLKSLHVSTFDTRSVTTMQGMFEGCTALPALDLRQQACTANSGSYQSWDTSSVTRMSTMFKECSSLGSINVTGFDTSNVQDMAEMFASCTSLRALDVSNFDTAQCMDRTSFAGLYQFAHDCPSLTQITLGPSFGQTNTAHSPGSSRGMFYVGNPYTAQSPLGTKVTGANATMLAYGWSVDHRGYTITVKAETGGAVTTNLTAAVNGQTITLTPTADTGYVYEGATVKYTAENGLPQTISLSADDTSFTMPASDVTITPKWLLPVPVLASSQNWYDQGGTTVARSSITSIEIKDEYMPSSYVTKWDASDGQIGTVTAYVENDGTGNGTYKLTIAGNGYGKIFANANSYRTFGNFTNVTAIRGLANNGTAILDTSKATTMKSMFAQCYKLAAVDVSKFNTSNVTDFSYMFVDCEKLEVLNVSSFDTRKAMTMTSMFSCCYKLNGIDVSSWNVSNVGPMDYMFDMCHSLTSLAVTNWDVSNVTTTHSMFQDCESLVTLNTSNWVFSENLTDTSYMFNLCESLSALDVSKWNVSKVTTMECMFNCCNSLETLAVDKWNVSSVLDMGLMFRECTNLTSLNVSNWNTSSCKKMDRMFECCTSLTTLSVDTWDVRNLVDASVMFYGCSNLTVLNVSDWVTDSLTTVTGTSSTTSGSWDLGMFEKCRKLAVIDISDWNMSKIKNNAHMFYDCTSLTELTIPGSLSIISPEFAYNCTTLTQITFNHAVGAKPTTPAAGRKTSETYTDAERDATGVYSDGGAFYVPSYLKTTIVGNNNISSPSVYDWITDNRMKVGISSATLAYDDVRVGDTVPAQLEILPENSNSYQSIQYTVVSGGSYASVNASTGVVTGKAKGTATIKVTIVDANGNTITATAPVKVLAIGITSATLAYDDVRVGATVDPDLVISPSNAGQYQSIKYEVTAGSTYASVNASTGVVTGKAKGTATIKVTIVDANGATVTATAPVKVLAISITSATLAYNDVRVGETVNPNLTINPSNAGQYQSIKYEVTAGSTYASVNSSTGVVTGKAKGTATIKVTIVDANGATVTAMAPVNVLAVSITSASLTYADVNVGETVNPNLTINPSNAGQYQSIKYEVTAGSTYASVNSSTGVVTGKAKGTATIKVTIVDANGNTITATGTVNVLETTITVTYNANGGSFTSGTTNSVVYRMAPGKVTSTKTSKTANVSTDGSTFDPVGYGDSQSVTDVVQIPGATSLTVTIKYATENTSFDWISIYDGSVTPTDSNYEKSITGKLGGGKATISTATFTIPGDTAQFHFVSDNSVSNFFGYYAEVSATIDGYVPTAASGTYAEPTGKRYMSFAGWYTNAACTAGNEFNLNKATSNITVYAKWDTVIPVLAAQDTWYTQGNTGIDKTSITSITLKTWYNPSSYVKKWDASAGQVGTVTAYLENGSTSGTYKLTISGNEYSRIYANPDSSFAFSDYKAITSISGLSVLDTRNVTTMEEMFYDDEKLTSLDVSAFDTGKVEKFRNMFSMCEKLTSLDVSNFDTRSGKDFGAMFRYCIAMKTLNISTKSVTMNGKTYNSWDTINAEKLSSMFSECDILTTLDVSHFDTRKVFDHSGMFYACEALSNLNIATKSVTMNGRTFDSWDTQSSEDMEYMFFKCQALTTLDVSHFDTADVTSFNSMFDAANKLASLSLRDTSVTQNGRTFVSWVTSSATNMSGMFYACNALPNMDVTYFDTSKVTDFSSMFYGCTKFTTLNVSTFDTRSVTDPECMEHFAHSCPALKTIILGNNFGQAATLPKPGAITGMFYYRDTIATTVKGANSAMKAYGWSTDSRTVSFTS